MLAIKKTFSQFIAFGLLAAFLLQPFILSEAGVIGQQELPVCCDAICCMNMYMPFCSDFDGLPDFIVGLR